MINIGFKKFNKQAKLILYITCWLRQINTKLIIITYIIFVLLSMANFSNSSIYIFMEPYFINDGPLYSRITNLCRNYRTADIINQFYSMVKFLIYILCKKITIPIKKYTRFHYVYCTRINKI